MPYFQIRKNAEINFPHLCPVCGKGNDLYKVCKVPTKNEKGVHNTHKTTLVEIHNNCWKKFKISKLKYLIFIVLLICVFGPLMFFGTTFDGEVWIIVASLIFFAVRFSLPLPIYLMVCEHHIEVEINNKRYAHEFEKLNESDFVQSV